MATMPVNEPPKKTTGQLASEALQAKSLAISEAADRRLDRLRDGNGKFLAKLSEQDWEDILDRLEAGELEANIARAYSVSRAAIHAHRRHNPAFAERYFQAIQQRYVNLAQDISAVTRGVEGYSTGDVRRDELIAKYDLELAKRFAPQVLGDRLQVDQRTITINIDRDDTEW